MNVQREPKSQPTLLVNPDEAAAMMGLHRSRIFPLLKSGAIPSVKIGRSRRIRTQDIELFIQRLLEEQASDA